VFGDVGDVLGGYPYRKAAAGAICDRGEVVPVHAAGDLVERL
jgi:hypothetical protein